MTTRTEAMKKCLFGYRFITIEDVSTVQESWLAKATALKLKGSILLSEEGVNISIVGEAGTVDAFRDFLEQDERFSGIDYKVNWATGNPYRRMLVKIKEEIITFNVPGVDPRKKTAPHVSAKQLKAWLDEGKVVMLDTRNQFEVEFGAFKHAKRFNIRYFSQFPKALAEQKTWDKKQPIVTYCTGGIRCEKAAALMMDQGFENVYQLDGGILKYFEEVGGDHYEGECFVFDHRIAVDAQLNQTGTKQCEVCDSPVPTAWQNNADEYQRGMKCPSCCATE